MELEKKLKSLGFDLPNTPVPAANYIGSVRVGNLLFVGGNIGRINGALKYRERIGGAAIIGSSCRLNRCRALNFDWRDPLTFRSIGNPRALDLILGDPALSGEKLGKKADCLIGARCSHVTDGGAVGV